MAVWALTVNHRTWVPYHRELDIVISADRVFSLHIPQLPSCTWPYLGRAWPLEPGALSAWRLF